MLAELEKGAATEDLASQMCDLTEKNLLSNKILTLLP